MQVSRVGQKSQTPGPAPPSPDELRSRRHTPMRRFLRRFARHRLGLIGAVVLSLTILTALAAPWLAAYDPNKTNMELINGPPSWEHVLGHDELGRDISARILYGARVSLAVGMVAVSIYTVIGVLLGSISGYIGGRVDELIQRFTEIIMCFPSFMLIMTVVVVLKPSIFNIMIIIGLFGWTDIVRLVRGQILSLRERDYVVAARMVGQGEWTILFKHVLPGTISPIVVRATLGLSGAIMVESGLSFLGIGVQAPQASWGSMLTTAMSLPVLESKPWRWLPPAVALATVVLAVNFIGDALRDALDPLTSEY